MINFKCVLMELHVNLMNKKFDDLEIKFVRLIDSKDETANEIKCMRKFGLELEFENELLIQ